MSEENFGPMPNAKSPKKIKNKRIKILLRFPKEFVDFFDTHRVVALCFKIEYERLYLTLSHNSNTGAIKENIIPKYLVGNDSLFPSSSETAAIMENIPSVLSLAFLPQFALAFIDVCRVSSKHAEITEKIFLKYLVGHDRLFLALSRNPKSTAR